MTFWQPPFAPKPYFPEKGQRTLEALKEKFTDIKKNDPTTLFDGFRKDLIVGISGNSPFLEKLMLKEHAFLESILTKGPTEVQKSFFLDIEEKTKDISNVNDLKALYRAAKGQLSLLVGLADISREWTLEQVTTSLSRFADLSLKAGTSFLIYEQMQLGNIKWPKNKPESFSIEIGDQSGFVVLALGKLGGRELNYSSDVDLIILFDEMTTPYCGKKSPGECFVKLTRNLIRFMDERTPQGYIFRTDLRLRPDPGATPLAMSMGAAESYYQSIGQNWERSAMIKARVCAGDFEAGNRFLERLRPFVWRKNLDYTAIADIHAIKARVHEHHQHQDIGVNGHDIKLSRGGIREIEFQAQIPQLIYGGRDWRLRTRPTIEALKAVCRSGRLPMEAFFELESAYVFFRTIEHRLQMVNDEQTHLIPEDDKGVEHLSLFLGFNDVKEFRKKLLHNLILVNNHYATLPGGESKNEVSSVDLETIKELLVKLGFKDAKSSAEIIKKWRSGRYKALKTERARTLLEDSIQNILESFGNTSNPDKGIARFDDFLSQLPAGVQLFSLFQANKWLFRVLARIMGSSPLLAKHLARSPQLLDTVLDPHFFETLPKKEDLRKNLKTKLKMAKDIQDIMDIFRRWLNDIKFEVGVHLIESLIDINQAGTALSDIADIVIEEFLPEIIKEFKINNGNFPDGELALVAMGSYGGKDLSYVSDLDLILLYRVDDPNGVSSKKSLPASQYFSRLGNHVITGLTARTSEGQLYEIDMRLRPSGKSGPLVVTLETFKDYQLNSAWIWEHMALTRARVVIGSTGFKKKIETTIFEALSLKRDPNKLLTNTYDMRERIRKEFGTKNIWDTKQIKGGLVDLEFICQYLQLKEGHKKPNIFKNNIQDSIQSLANENILSSDEASGLISSHQLQLTIQGILRLCYQEEALEEEFSQELKFIIMDLVGITDFEDLKTQLEEAQSLVYALYQEIIVQPALKILEKEENKNGS